MTSDSLPFAAEVRLPRAARDLVLVLEIIGEFAEVGLDPIAQIIDAFCVAAGRGAFPAEMHPGVRSHMNLRSRERGRGGGFLFRFDVRGISIGAYRVLLNALTQCHYHRRRLVYVGLMSEADRRDDLDLGNVLGESFPKRLPVPFTVSEEVNLDDAKDTAFRFSFHRPFGAEELLSLTTVMQSWDTLVASGSFRASVGRMEDLHTEPAVTCLVAPTIVEHVCYGYDVTRAGFDSMINLAFRLHLDVVPLVKLTIE